MKAKKHTNGASSASHLGSGDAAAAPPPPPAPSHARARSAYSFPAMTQFDLMRVAVEASIAQPRTVVRYLRGLPVVSSTRERIERALRVLNLGRFIRDVAEAPTPATAPPSSRR